MPADQFSISAQGLRRVAIIVLGMHRSGTSALTWLLGQMGAALPNDAIAASEENERGYWESAALVLANDRLIRSEASSWFDPRPLDLSRIPSDLLNECRQSIRRAIIDAWGSAPLIAIKDPRQCRLVPVAIDVLCELEVQPRVILMLRSADEVAKSIRQRDGSTLDYAKLLWLRHMLVAERDSRALNRVVVSYGELLADWRGVACRVAPLLGQEGWVINNPEAIDAFLDPRLRHHIAKREAATSIVGELVHAAENALGLLLTGDTATAYTTLDSLASQLDMMPWIGDDVVHDELRHRRVPTAHDTSVDALPACAGLPQALEENVMRSQTAHLPDVADAELIRLSGLFDESWYAATYPDVDQSGLDPIAHYLAIGAAEGRNPGPLFNTAYYARQMARRFPAEGLVA